MIKNSGNIEELLKESFSNFEADVAPAAWSNIEAGISKTAVSGKAGSASKGLLVKLLGAAAITGGIVAGIILLNNDSPENTIVENKQPVNVLDKNQSYFIEEEGVKENSDNINQNPVVTSIKEKAEGGRVSNNTVLSEEKETITEPAREFNKSETGSKNGANNSERQETPITNDEPADIVQPPVANILASQFSGDAPLTVRFSNDGSGASYEWDFGDGKGISPLATPTRVFDKPGDYKVMLTVRDANNNVAKDFLTIRVKGATIVSIPNVFTPNGDYQNDRFEIKGEGIKSIEGTILDQSGKTIHQWYMLNESWNGTLADGSDAPEGDYYYIIKYIGPDDKTTVKKGLVRLKR